jgi:hypothetical protein
MTTTVSNATMYLQSITVDPVGTQTITQTPITLEALEQWTSNNKGQLSTSTVVNGITTHTFPVMINNKDITNEK